MESKFNFDDYNPFESEESNQDTTNKATLYSLVKVLDEELSRRNVSHQDFITAICESVLGTYSINSSNANTSSSHVLNNNNSNRLSIPRIIESDDKKSTYILHKKEKRDLLTLQTIVSMYSCDVREIHVTTLFDTNTKMKNSNNKKVRNDWTKFLNKLIKDSGIDNVIDDYDSLILNYYSKLLYQLIIYKQVLLNDIYRVRTLQSSSNTILENGPILEKLKKELIHARENINKTN